MKSPLLLVALLLLTAGCSTVSGSTSGSEAGDGRWRPRPGTAWQWQLTGRIDTSVDVPVYDVDGFDQSKALATIIDGNMGGTGSRTAANAAACAQDVGKFPGYHDVLYENQPEETSDDYAEAAAVDLAALGDERLELVVDVVLAGEGGVAGGREAAGGEAVE